MIEVEKEFRVKQVKFLTTKSELDEIEKYAIIEDQTKSNFIRTCIWDKIQLLKKSKDDRKARDRELSSTLVVIKERLRVLTRLERKQLEMIAGLELREKELKRKLETIKKRLIR